MEELVKIVTKFTESSWDLINIPSKAWLSANNEDRKNNTTKELIIAIKQADKEYGNCGCEYDPLYKRALELLDSVA